MGGEIVGDDINLFTLRMRTDQIGEKGHELGTGVSIGRFAYDGTTGGIQGRIQRERSVAVVLESVSFGSTGKEAGLDRAGRALEWQSFRPHRKPPHGPGA